MPARRGFVPACDGLEGRLCLSGLRHLAALQGHIHTAVATQHGHANGQAGQHHHGQPGNTHGFGMVHINILPYPYGGGGGSGSGGTGGSGGGGG